jgi:hypothetical protein
LAKKDEQQKDVGAVWLLGPASRLKIAFPGNFCISGKGQYRSYVLYPIFYKNKIVDKV